MKSKKANSIFNLISYYTKEFLLIFLQLPSKPNFCMISTFDDSFNVALF